MQAGVLRSWRRPAMAKWAKILLACVLCSALGAALIWLAGRFA
jgi:hypothetical protein